MECGVVGGWWLVVGCCILCVCVFWFVCYLLCNMPPETNSNDFGGLELISKFEFDFPRRGNYIF